MSAKAMEKDKRKYRGFGKDLLQSTPTGEEQEEEEEHQAVDGTEQLFHGGRDIESLEINRRLKEGMQLQGFSKLTSIQAASLDPMLADGDLLIKSETGSGKTLAYLLPLLERILRWTATNRIDRSYGTIAILLVPTRELAEQCHEVLQKTTQKCAFLITGCIKGGEQKKKEKARLRHGVHILVATVGRLVDHLKTTESFDVSKLQYLVLDEADRLLDMGYEKDIRTIKKILDAKKAPIMKSVLVSATLGSGIQKLSHFMLKDPKVIGKSLERRDEAENGAADNEVDAELIVPPSLAQHYVVTPCKLRLVSLLAFLKWKMDEGHDGSAPTAPRIYDSATTALEGHSKVVVIRPKDVEEGTGGCKILVFLSSSDSVEYHYALLSRLRIPGKKERTAEAIEAAATRKKISKKRKGAQRQMQAEANLHIDDDEEDIKEFEEEEAPTTDMLDGGAQDNKVPFLDCDLFKLHGNMTQLNRTSVFMAFRQCRNGVLFATDVAARGLDLPSVRWIIQYDPAGEEKSYIHRIGRTARAGKTGDALLFVQPHEEEYVKNLQAKSMKFSKMTSELLLFHLSRMLGGTHLLECASQLHQYIENEVVASPELRRMSAVAYQAYLRAYSAYPKRLKHIFSVNNLHLGHVAKSFAIVKNPKKIREVAKQSTDEYEPAIVKKKKMKEMDEIKAGVKRARDPDADLQAARRAFRNPIATSKAGQLSEFDSGAVGPAPKKKVKIAKKK